MSQLNHNSADHLVATVRCSDYSENNMAAAVERIIELLPSFPESIKTDGVILVKPNLLSPRSPTEGVTTHPAVVEAVVRKCFDYGAKEVWLGDSCASDHADEKLWGKTGMTEVSKRTGAVLKSFRAPLMSQTIHDSEVPLPAWLQEVDAWISIPKLKTHDLTVLTCAVKNSFGLVVGRAKSQLHAKYPSPASLSRFILALHNRFPPDFIFVDAVESMEGHGPANGRIRKTGLLLAGKNAVAVDTICTQLLNEKPSRIPTLKEAMTNSPTDEEIIKNVRVAGDCDECFGQPPLKPSSGSFLQKIPDPLFQFGALFLGRQPRIDPERCRGCGLCADICSQDTIKPVTQTDGKQVYKIDRSKCITCFCCSEVCPYKAVVTSLRGRMKIIFWAIVKS